MEFRKLDMSYEEEIKDVIKDAFSIEPWNDNWDDDDIFHEYLLDLAGNRNSLVFGLYDEGQLKGVCLGRLKHWFDGIEYCIDDFGIKTDCQGRGFGAKLFDHVYEYAKANDFKGVGLWTEKSAQAYYFYKKIGFVESEEWVCFEYKI